MKRILILLAMAGVLMISGCFPKGGWYKPDMTPEGFSSDRDQCLRSSVIPNDEVYRRSGPKIDLKDPRDGKIKTIDLSDFSNCMQRNGYRWEKNVDTKTGKLKDK